MNLAGYIFYAHNLSRFDGPLLIEYLADIKGLKIRPLLKNNEIYSIKFTMTTAEMDPDWIAANAGPRGGESKFKKSATVRIVLQDSYKMLPWSLEGLGKTFDVATLKGTFPHDFVSVERLDYVGVSPCGRIPD